MVFEGGYVSDPNDPGGETKFGISKRSYPQEDIAGLTKERAQEIYHTDFWVPLKCDSMKFHDVAIEVFECAVNMGHAIAGKILQKGLNALVGAAIHEDGIVGIQTIVALNNCKYPHDLLQVLNGLQLSRYVDLVRGNDTLRPFLRGWLRRTHYRSIA